MTLPTQFVLKALLADPVREMYGAEIGAVAGLPSGTVHPILARLEGVQWLESRWEDINPRVEGRPARRYYRLTAGGIEAAGSALARTGRPAPTPQLRPVQQT
jgi:DNA-binding PadR family transcriptional regulator